MAFSFRLQGFATFYFLYNLIYYPVFSIIQLFSSLLIAFIIMLHTILQA